MATMPKKITKATTTAPAPKVKPISRLTPQEKAKRVEWELILKWKAVKDKPFVYQKITFPAPPLMKDAYREAVHIRNLICNGGAYAASDVHLIAVSRAGALAAHDAEKGIAARANAAAMVAAMRAAREMSQTKTKVPVAPEPPSGKIKTRG